MALGLRTLRAVVNEGTAGDTLNFSRKKLARDSHLVQNYTAPTVSYLIAQRSTLQPTKLLLSEAEPALRN